MFILVKIQFYMWNVQHRILGIRERSITVDRQHCWKFGAGFQSPSLKPWSTSECTYSYIWTALHLHLATALRSYSGFGFIYNPIYTLLLWAVEKHQWLRGSYVCICEYACVWFEYLVIVCVSVFVPHNNWNYCVGVEINRENTHSHIATWPTSEQARTINITPRETHFCYILDYLALWIHNHYIEGEFDATHWLRDVEYGQRTMSKA